MRKEPFIREVEAVGGGRGSRRGERGATNAPGVVGGGGNIGCYALVVIL